MKISLQLDIAHIEALARVAAEGHHAPPSATVTTQFILSQIVCLAAGKMLLANIPIPNSVAIVVDADHSTYRPRRPSLLARRKQANYAQ